MVPDDFYIGYETPVPAVARPRVFGAVGAGLALIVILAVVVVSSQRPFADSEFAFGTFTEHTGVIRFAPHPVLDAGQRRELLVAPGKHGADDLVRAFAGQAVTLAATEIRRGDMRMLEVRQDSVRVLATPPSDDLTSLAPLGDRTLMGEILDGKCYLGVMNPGEGTVHRDCATVCLRGGIPPLLAVSTPDRRTAVFHLEGPDGEAVGTRYAHLAGRPVRVTGSAFHRQPDGAFVIRARLVELAGITR